MRYGFKMMLSFFMVLMLVAVLLSAFITLRLTALTSIPMWGRFFVAGGVMLAFLSPFLLRDGLGEMSEKWYNGLTYAAYFLFVTVFLLFSFMLLRDVLWAFLRWVMPERIASPFQPLAVMKANLILTILVVSIASYALYAGTRIPNVKSVTIASDKITQPLTVAVLSDLHLHRALSLRKLQGIVRRTNDLNPDLIVLPGDTIDDRPEAIRHLLPVLAQLKAKMGVYATDGNHEIYTGSDVAKQMLAEQGIIYLRNTNQMVSDTIRIAGIPDVQGHRIGQPPMPDVAMPTVSESVFTILLSHTPKTFDLPDNTADLQISGHTHGGQIFPFHALVKLANTYLSGLYRNDRRMLYVSRGAGQWGPQMRFLSPSEISLITIIPLK